MIIKKYQLRSQSVAAARKFYEYLSIHHPNKHVFEVDSIMKSFIDCLKADNEDTSYFTDLHWFIVRKILTEYTNSIHLHRYGGKSFIFVFPIEE